MKRQRVLCLLLALSLALGLAVTAQAAERRAADFPDFDSRAWYAEAMTAAVEDGLLRGTDKGLLNPQGDLTRAEMAAIINRAFGTYALGDVSSYRDVSPQAWYYSDVRMAVHMGTYEGRDARTMDPDSGITRQEAMTVVARALQLDTADYQDASLSRFQDRGEVSSWALPYTWVFVDEAYLFFKYVFSAQFLYKAWKRFRKYAGIMTAATQNVEECLRSETARLMFANSEFLVLYNQAATDRAELAKLLRISDTQMGYITNSAPGTGLIRMGGAIVPFINTIPKDTQLYRLMSTTPGDEAETARVPSWDRSDG